MSDTPRTDELWRVWKTESVHRQVGALYEHAKELERENIRIVTECRAADRAADVAEAKLAARPEVDAPRVGLPLLYNIVCLWAQPKDDQWRKDMAELCRLADKLLYEQGYEVSPYTVNEHQVARDSSAPSPRGTPDNHEKMFSLSAEEFDKTFGKD